MPARMRQRIGKLGERLIGKVVDAEAQVEKALIQELENAFKEFEFIRSCRCSVP